jgi:hypothetical protein
MFILRMNINLHRFLKYISNICMKGFGHEEVTLRVLASVLEYVPHT